MASQVRGHHEDWFDAVLDRKQAGSNFDHGGPLAELALLSPPLRAGWML
jgi:hypothetical protein